MTAMDGGNTGNAGAIASANNQITGLDDLLKNETDS